MQELLAGPALSTHGKARFGVTLFSQSLRLTSAAGCHKFGPWLNLFIVEKLSVHLVRFPFPVLGVQRLRDKRLQATRDRFELALASLSAHGLLRSLPEPHHGGSGVDALVPSRTKLSMPSCIARPCNWPKHKQGSRGLLTAPAETFHPNSIFQVVLCPDTRPGP